MMPSKIAESKSCARQESMAPTWVAPGVVNQVFYTCTAVQEICI